MPRASLLLTLLVLSTLSVANATQVTLSASTSGTWTTSSTNTNGNQLYIAGVGNTTDYANFFVFDLSGVTGVITGAQFYVNALGSDSAGDYTMFDVSTSIATLVNLNNNPSPAIYGDLTSGTAFGNIRLNGTERDQFITITLNAAAIAALQAAVGVGQVALGGGFDPDAATGVAFANGGFPPEQSNLKQLILEVSNVPEPSTVALMGVGLAAACGVRRYRRPS